MLPRLAVTQHRLAVPLDHTDRGGEQIEIFAREVADAEAGTDRPRLLFLQGGPGHESPRPIRARAEPAWLERALRDYRVVFLDQRGTGLSTPLGEHDGVSPEGRAAYLTHFRADAIVRDAELLRAALGVERWSALGQSFGGMCAVTYLSLAPDSLREVFICGGLPAVGRPIDDVYRLTYARTLERNRRFFASHPEDLERVSRLREALEAGRVRLPGGEPLSWRRFRQLGGMLGASGGAEHLHYLLEQPANGPAFAHDVAAALPFARNPIYAVLQEACWADGGTTRWAAERLLPPEIEADPLFTAEHVFPWMFEEDRGLRFLRDAASELAQHRWPPLYDAAVLAANEVPVFAAVYLDDLYVPRELAEETGGRIRGLRAWMTNEFEHNGLTASGERVIGRLLDMARGRA